MQKIKDFIYYNRKEIIIFTIFLVFIICYIFITKNQNNNYDSEIIYEEKNNIINDIPQEDKIIMVDIKGEVKMPGTYEFNEEQRVIDAIEKAGGLSSNANTNEINLSEKLFDEMLIYIPSKEEYNEKTKETNKKAITDGKISINTASISELTKIKGIGESKAKKIIEYRKEFGKFKTIEDIKNVSGIGNATFEKIKDSIKV